MANFTYGTHKGKSQAVCDLLVWYFIPPHLEHMWKREISNDSKSRDAAHYSTSEFQLLECRNIKKKLQNKFELFE